MAPILGQADLENEMTATVPLIFLLLNAFISQPFCSPFKKKVPPCPSLSSTLFYKYVLPPEHFGIFKGPSRAGPRTVRRPLEGPSPL